MTKEADQEIKKHESVFFDLSDDEIGCIAEFSTNQEILNLCLTSKSICDIVTKYMRPHRQEYQPLIEYSSTGDVACVKALLKHPRIDPAVNNSYALVVAITNGHTEIVRMLLNENRINKSDDFLGNAIEAEIPFSIQ